MRVGELDSARKVQVLRDRSLGRYIRHRKPMGIDANGLGGAGFGKNAQSGA
jgi:hypothetical protein